MANSTLCKDTADITTNVKINRIGDTTYRFSNVDLSKITKLSIGTFCYNNAVNEPISNEIITTNLYYCDNKITVDNYTGTATTEYVQDGNGTKFMFFYLPPYTVK